MKSYFSKNPSITEISLLLNKYLFLIGISSYSAIIFDTNEFRPNLRTKYMFYTFLIKALSIVVAILSIYYYKWHFVTLNENIRNCMDLVRTSMAILLPVLLFFRQGKARLLLKATNDIDVTFNNCNLLKKKPSNNLLYISVILSIGYSICFLILSIFVDLTFNFGTAKENHLLVSTSHYVANLLINGILTGFIATLHFALERFKCLNDSIRQLIRRKRNTKDILLLYKYHDDLVEYCRQSNSLYGIYVLIAMSSTYVILIITTYDLIESYNKNASNLNVSLCIWYVFYVLMLFVIIYFCDYVTCEVNYC